MPAAGLHAAYVVAVWCDALHEHEGARHVQPNAVALLLQHVVNVSLGEVPRSGVGTQAQTPCQVSNTVVRMTCCSEYQQLSSPPGKHFYGEQKVTHTLSVTPRQELLTNFGTC